MKSAKISARHEYSFSSQVPNVAPVLLPTYFYSPLLVWTPTFLETAVCTKLNLFLNHGSTACYTVYSA